MSFWNVLGPLIRVNQCLNKTSYLNIAADPVYSVVLIVYPNSDGYFKQQNTFCNSGGIVHKINLKNMKKGLLYLSGLHKLCISIRFSISWIQLKEL